MDYPSKDAPPMYQFQEHNPYAPENQHQNPYTDPLQHPNSLASDHEEQTAEGYYQPGQQSHLDSLPRPERDLTPSYPTKPITPPQQDLNPNQNKIPARLFDGYFEYDEAYYEPITIENSPEFSITNLTFINIFNLIVVLVPTIVMVLNIQTLWNLEELKENRSGLKTIAVWIALCFVYIAHNTLWVFVVHLCQCLSNSNPEQQQQQHGQHQHGDHTCPLLSQAPGNDSSDTIVIVDRSYSLTSTQSLGQQNLQNDLSSSQTFITAGKHVQWHFASYHIFGFILPIASVISIISSQNIAEKLYDLDFKYQDAVTLILICSCFLTGVFVISIPVGLWIRITLACIVIACVVMAQSNSSPNGRRSNTVYHAGHMHSTEIVCGSACLCCDDCCDQDGQDQKPLQKKRTKRVKLTSGEIPPPDRFYIVNQYSVNLSTTLGATTTENTLMI